MIDSVSLETTGKSQRIACSREIVQQDYDAQQGDMN